jgi:hypothetical protein
MGSGVAVAESLNIQLSNIDAGLFRCARMEDSCRPFWFYHEPDRRAGAELSKWLIPLGR